MKKNVYIVYRQSRVRIIYIRCLSQMNNNKKKTEEESAEPQDVLVHSGKLLLQ